MYTKVKREISIQTCTIFSQACMHIIHGLLSVLLVLQIFLLHVEVPNIKAF